MDQQTRTIFDHARACSLKTVFERFLCHGGVLLVVDRDAQGVVLPAGLPSEVVLDYDEDPQLPVPIVDIETSEEGVTATLSFARVPCKTFVPWTAVRVLAAKRQGPAVERPAPSRPALKLV